MDEYVRLFQDYSPLITPAISIVTFIAGMFIGHWLSLGRDKRKEFNAVADPVRFALLEQIDSLNGGLFPNRLIEKFDINKIAMVAGKRSGNAISSAFDDYRKAAIESGSRDQYGKFTFNSQMSVEHLRKSIQSLISSIKRR
ncbi:hypothetical protein [Morganella morganii]|uniref:hypothetical protein n=1 Tax=Morganella morganii TaxID=582 RepID=UPI00046A536D|nr:hypothetical protein [Morganella morganii]